MISTELQHIPRPGQPLRFELLGDFALKDAFLAKVRVITAADLTRVARTWFASERKSVGVLVPKP